MSHNRITVPLVWRGEDDLFPFRCVSVYRAANISDKTAFALDYPLVGTATGPYEKEIASPIVGVTDGSVYAEGKQLHAEYDGQVTLQASDYCQVESAEAFTAGAYLQSRADGRVGNIPQPEFQLTAQIVHFVAMENSTAAGQIVWAARVYGWPYSVLPPAIVPH
jgi:hypothetical protein